MLRTHSPQETRLVGAELAKVLQPGDVILLLGDLGAGKSELTRGIARGLGIEGPIASPSFTIMNLYEDGRIPLCHFDWYRLNDSSELYEMGLDEYLGGDDVAVIEWPSQCPDAVPACCLEITIRPLDESEREISWRSLGGFRSIELKEIGNEPVGN